MNIKRRPQQPELQPVCMRPIFDRRERAALRDFKRAAFRGERKRPKLGEFDPLWLRMGMRCHQIESRAGWVVSNPSYDRLLRERPNLDPSLAGPTWLREVYRWRHYDLVTSPAVRAAIDERLRELRAAEMPQRSNPTETANAAQPQGDLFAEAHP